MDIDKIEAKAESNGRGERRLSSPGSWGLGSVSGCIETKAAFTQPDVNAKNLMAKKGSIFILLSILVSLVLGSCSEASIGSANPARSVRPVAKIGLIAPFEGLYRRTGYESLAAMRAALADNAALTQTAGIDLLPLALDDSGDPQRAVRTAQKLTADPAVAAIIGPINPWTFHATATILSATNLPWERPHLATKTEEEWLFELVSAVNRASHQQGAKRLLIRVDRDYDRLISKNASQIASNGLPLAFMLSSLAPPAETVVDGAIKSGDAILFLGAPADAASFVSALRELEKQWETDEAIPFWMGPQGGDPIFFERATRVDNVYWATWLDDGYTDWAASHQPATPAAYLVYKATQRAIHAVVNPEQVQEKETPTMHLFSVAPNGISVAIEQ